MGSHCFLAAIDKSICTHTHTQAHLLDTQRQSTKKRKELDKFKSERECVRDITAALITEATEANCSSNGKCREWRECLKQKERNDNVAKTAEVPFGNLRN